MASKLTNLTSQKTARQLQTMSEESFKWLLKKIARLKGASAIPGEIKKEDFRNTRTLKAGQMYYFFYDAKGKDDLPYYDKFPLVLILEKYNDGFLGLNLHYLPIRYRVAFLGKLLDYAVMTPDNDIKRMRITYDILNATKKYKEFRPCVKRYLFSHIRSKILTVQENEWDVATVLPVHQFVGQGGAKKVWEDSLEQIRNP